MTLFLLFLKAQRGTSFDLYVETDGWFFMVDHFHDTRWLAVHVREVMQMFVICPSAYTELSHGHFPGIGPHNLGEKWNVHTPGVGGRASGFLRHGTGHQLAHHHPLKYNTPVLTYLSINLKRQVNYSCPYIIQISLQCSTIASSLRLHFPSNCPPPKIR